MLKCLKYSGSNKFDIEAVCSSNDNSIVIIKRYQILETRRAFLETIVHASAVASTTLCNRRGNANLFYKTLINAPNEIARLSDKAPIVQTSFTKLYLNVPKIII